MAAVQSITIPSQVRRVLHSPEGTHGRRLQDPGSAHVCTSGAELWASLLALALTKAHTIPAEVKVKLSWAGGAPRQRLVFSLLIAAPCRAGCRLLEFTHSCRAARNAACAGLGPTELE